MGFSNHRAITLIFFNLLLSLSMKYVVVNGSKNQDVDSLGIPSTNILVPLKYAVGVARNMSAILSRYVNDEDLHLKNIVDDCLDLFSYSIDELNRTISTLENLDVEDRGTGNQISDLKTWLSAAMANHDTCATELNTTSSVIQNKFGGNIRNVTSLIKEVLDRVAQTPSNIYVGDQNNKPIESNKIPHWMEGKEKSLLESPINNLKVNVVVAKDGSGSYTSVTDAILAAPNNSNTRYVIYVKRGVYNENVDIGKMKWRLMIVGDGMDQTIITGKRSNGTNWTTFSSGTLAVAGERFIARDISFQNSAGPQGNQAVAVRSDSDLSIFFRCGIIGYQDTLYARNQRQFYKECRIAGTIDFIFGNGQVVLQSCIIIARKPLPGQQNSITAQGRNHSNEASGFIFQFCKISGEPNLQDSSTYLGRPWGKYSRTVFMQSFISNVINPQGWLEWNKTLYTDTLYYAEYQNNGPGAILNRRVKWPGYHPVLQYSEASKFTVSQFIKGDSWLPEEGIPYHSGLLP